MKKLPQVHDSESLKPKNPRERATKVSTAFPVKWHNPKLPPPIKNPPKVPPTWLYPTGPICTPSTSLSPPSYPLAHRSLGNPWTHLLAHHIIVFLVQHGCMLVPWLIIVALWRHPSARAAPGLHHLSLSLMRARRFVQAVPQPNRPRREPIPPEW